MSATRARHGAEDEEIAYRLQVMGAREGFIKGALVGGTLMALANWRFPWVQRQTLAGKTCVASWVAIFGMVTHADHYLLEWEQQHRVQSERWRTMARNELAAKGTVPSETAMRAWKASYDAKLRATRDAQTTAPESPAAAAAPAGIASVEGGRSQVLQELEAAKHEKEGGVDAPNA
ncbi:uncharacterized protein RHOBADRAFT_65104 [Rhodotorula graminis WP1]|uniref:Uncharacterized protein n=1 Tax=Rhodotorula graminis (strain WP1) TaxID=578459 RepID=A0A194S2W3_RHOGW|nr:uncharacterized protein RHOBADRAFT_65104 [Rhodotorula graminis WP1]KPV74927.1 hypothetical protein RHOBADRAFT_65104 [Rhodotorula graminis WP1]